jgi:signal transduction histidine kinase
LRVSIDYVKRRYATSSDRLMKNQENLVASDIDPPVLLVVSVDEQLRDYLFKTLDAHYDNVRSANHAQAISFLQQEAFTLIIVDILQNKTPDWQFFEKIQMLTIEQHCSMLLIQNFPLPTGIENAIDDYIALDELDTPHFLRRVTLQIKHHDQLFEKINIIQQLNYRREIHRQLAQIARHDLRHPLTNIRISEVMLRELLLDDTSKPFLDTLLLSINNMETMFDDFMSAILVGERGLKSVAVDLQWCVDTVCLQYFVSATNKQIRLEQGNLNYVLLGDIQATEQIINNLVSNAIKYSFFNSVVYIEAHQEGSFVMIRVIDQGQGVLENERSVLFTEFGRVSSQPTNNEPSVGLGLWIVKQLTESMGGTVGADFPDEGGSIFWVKLPIYRKW